MKRLYEDHRLRPQSTMEKIIYHYIYTNKSQREVARYYGIPKSTLNSWLIKSSNLVDSDLFHRYRDTARMHKRKQAMIWNNKEEYWVIDGDGPRD